ncbi:hypothetical protein J2P12_01005 [Candidatus Bathyarchaeota archaeon]|nr:hypothetical protein [Candidatus Bathyarchaeota archaeon]
MDSDNSKRIGTISGLRSSEAPGYDGGSDLARLDSQNAIPAHEGMERVRGRSSRGNASTGNLSPQQVLGQIFTEFSRKRKQEKVAAWMWLQQALAENAGTLCPTAVSLKDLIAAEANIEEMLKGQQGDAGESPSEYLENWLSPEATKQ